MITVIRCLAEAILAEACPITTLLCGLGMMPLAVFRYGANTMMVSSPQSHRPAVTE